MEDLAELFVRTQDQSLAAAARSYSEAGLAVFACVAGAKRPLTAAGFTDATTDPDQIARWWTRWPAANIGLATGGGGFDVIDVDRRPSGSGFAALERTRAAGLTDGWICAVRTPSAGLHLYYPARPERPQHSWADTTAHLDVRGTGGYVIVPPSRIARTDGSVGTYRLDATGRHRLRPLDGGALQMLLRPPRPATRPSPSVAVSDAGGGRIAAWLARRPEGTRNNALYWAACRYADNTIAQSDAHQRLGAAAEQAGLEPGEIAATIRSAYRTSIASAATPQPRRPQVERCL